MEVLIDGARYAPVDGDDAAAREQERERLAKYIAEFTLEGSSYWKALFTNEHPAAGPGMYADGDEDAPFFTEAFLYNLLGKDEARSVLGIIRRLAVLAGVEVKV